MQSWELEHYLEHGNLSAVARRLAIAAGESDDVAAALKQDPSLMEGLNEYTKWREEVGKQIGSTPPSKPVAHEIVKVMRKLKKKKK